MKYRDIYIYIYIFEMRRSILGRIPQQMATPNEQ
jgi:hypothetical protein